MENEILSYLGKNTQIDRSIPLGRIGNTEEAANAITFLSSSASYVSGAQLILMVDS